MKGELLIQLKQVRLNYFYLYIQHTFIFLLNFIYFLIINFNNYFLYYLIIINLFR